MMSTTLYALDVIHRCTILFLLCSLLLHLSNAADQNQSHPLISCHEEERSALLEFKHTLNISRDCSGYHRYYCDESNKLESWKPKDDCCDWGGIICHNGHVINLNLSITCACGSSATNISLLLHRLPHLQELDLNSMDFHQSPAISSTISNSLRFLDLSYCNLIGELPVAIFELPKLEYLDLSYNGNLRGHFPHHFNRSSPLKMLRVSATNFSGEFPASLSNLWSLSYFDISFCHFRGLIPSSSLANLTHKLTYLSLQGNYFHGHIPPFPTLLTTLSLYRNLFTGEIPSSIGNLTQLTKLDLSYNQLTGPIPSFLTNLDRLESLSLSLNLLTGPIPSSLTSLRRLVHLSLASNQLTGPIPDSIDKLKQLRHLYLGSNKLTGPVPSQLGNLTHLVYLDLSSNQFTGSFPKNLARLTNLTLLDLSTNNLEDTLGFNTFSHFQSLSMLYLSFNTKLSLVFEPDMNVSRDKFLLLGLASCSLSEFPQFLQNQDSLGLLDLSYNNISGPVPLWLLSSASLYTLNLSGNSLIWPVSFNWTTNDLGVLDLRSNGLQGSLPNPPSFIEVYLVSDNKLSGEIPLSLCNLSRLRRLDLAKNNFSGSIPQCLTNLTSNYALSILSLSSNNLDGTIPDLLDIGNHSCKLRMMDVSDNRLQGPLPRSLLSSCNELEFLNVGNNSIYDSFPAWLGSLANLRVLILRSNRFHGAIDELDEDDNRDWFPKLQVIDISQNNFGGFLPSKLFQSWNGMRLLDEDGAKYIGESVLPYIFIFQTPETLQYDYSMMINNKGIEMVYAKILNYFIAIDLSSNNFSGEIPESVGSLARLRLLNLSNNVLTGHIPTFLKDLANLEALDLSHNILSGEIPQQLAQLTSLSFFNVSYNRLSGHIPRGKQFDTFQNNSYIGNLGLCGDPLSEDCGGTTPPPPYDEAEGSYFELEWPIILMGVASGLVVGVVMGLVTPVKRNNWLVRKISEFVRTWLDR